MVDFSYEGYAVSGISATSGFPRLGAEALAPDQIVGTYDDAPLPELPPALHAARDTYLAKLVARAEAEGKTCDNNLSYSLARVDVTRPEVNGRRIVVFKLKFRPTDYFHFQFPNNALDADIEVNGARTKARAALGLTAERQSLEELHPAPCHFKVGTGTVLVCAPERAGAPERVVVAIRSKRQLMVGRTEGPKFHLSAAEGMLRPADGPGGAPSPFRTAERSLHEELGLRPDAGDYDPAALRCLGLYLDTQRAQPFFLMFARIPLAFPEVVNRWQVAPHKHETLKLVGPRWDGRAAHRLLVGSFDEDGDSYDVASNHAQLGFLMAAAHEDELRRARAEPRFVFGAQDG